RLLLLSADPRLRLRLSMLLPNWGLRVSAVETTQEALDRLRTAANQGQPWAYSTVLADLAGMRNTALALYRNLGRQAVYGDLRLVCLYGEDPVAEELQRSVTLLSRQAPDADLRAALFGGGREDEERAASPAAVPTPAPAAAATGGEKPMSARKPRVLLVEDNPVNLMVGQRLLGVLGITCDTASNGEAALLRMSASRYDIVLMDCQMPVMDGYTATQRWRASEEASGDGRRLPIIAMTANAMAGDRQKCLDAGMDDYLPKPVTRSELERCLHRWWDPDQIVVPPEFADLVDTGASATSAVTVTELDPQFLGLPTEDAAVPEPASLPMHSDASPQPDPVVAEATTPATAPAAPATAAYVAPPVAVVDVPEAPRPVAAPTRTTQPPLLDTDILDDLHAMLGDEVERLIDVFLDDTPRLVQALENAAAGPDYDALRDAAHSLKSSSANLGAMSLSAAAKRVELAAREKSLERPAVAVALIANEFARVKQLMLARRRQAQQA
ncbi:MAG: response regulator, partial [Luteimonas sp.]|nr:response regulator [Luteimonas sp.]